MITRHTSAVQHRLVRTTFPVEIIFFLLFCVLLVQGCASSIDRNPVPEEYYQDAIFGDIPNARIWGDHPPELNDRWLEQATEEEISARFSGIFKSTHNYLAISGGGAQGAYGAGILAGWSESGSRPVFTIVTGVSTGALTAPFAFLGSEYDDELEEIYTTYSTSDLIESRSKITAIWRDSAVSSAPLQQIIASYVDESLVHAIAEEHTKGRRLYIGTTNMDAGRPVLWNIGEIAAVGGDLALETIRSLMLASAAIPGVFPPVYIEVSANGKDYEEMHVDGGTTTQINLYPVGFDWRSITDKFELNEPPDIYVIRNAKINPVYQPIKPRLLPITSRSIDSLIRTQGIGDMYRIYVSAMRDGIDYHLAYIPEEFTQNSTEFFDPVYMRALFDYGRIQGRTGTAWQDAPPGVVISQVMPSN